MKENYKYIKDKGFDKNPQNINRKGRRQKIYTILKEKGYSKDDVTTSFGELAFYTMEELREVESDKSKPIITRIVSKQFRVAYEKGNWAKIKEILEYVVGKPTQSTNLNIQSTQPIMKMVDARNHNDEEE